MRPSTLCFGNNLWTLSRVHLSDERDCSTYGNGLTFILHRRFVLLDEPFTLLA